MNADSVKTYERFRLAVALPCFNEAPALPEVLAQWQQALPEAEIYVFDNNSTDNSAEIARQFGARVVPVGRQGKGYVVRAIFAELADRDVVIMADADGTYPAAAVHDLLQPLLDDQADMTVGARVPVAELKAMSPVRGLGNVLIRFAFWLLMGLSAGDLLSGYRLFGQKFLKGVRLKSHGFEIETEIACKAVGGGWRVVEKPVSYLPRAAGTASKLRALRDGLRIIKMMAIQSFQLKPWRLGGLVVGLITLCAILTRSGLLWVAAGAAIGLLVAHVRSLVAANQKT